MICNVVRLRARSVEQFASKRPTASLVILIPDNNTHLRIKISQVDLFAERSSAKICNTASTIFAKLDQMVPWDEGNALRP